MGHVRYRRWSVRTVGAGIRPREEVTVAPDMVGHPRLSAKLTALDNMRR